MCVLMSVAGRHGPRQVVIYYNTSPDLCFTQACEVVSHVKEGRVCVIEKWKLRRNGLDAWSKAVQISKLQALALHQHL